MQQATPLPADAATDLAAQGIPASHASTPSFSPLYQQIKGLMLKSLQAGEWKPSEAIPSEMEFAARFRVSQGTVRKAIDELAAENLLIRRQGKGTFVATHAERHVQYRFLKLMPDDGDASSEGPAQRRIVDCRRQRASSDVARALNLRAGEAVLQVRVGFEFHAAGAATAPGVVHQDVETAEVLRGGVYHCQHVILSFDIGAQELHPCAGLGRDLARCCHARGLVHFGDEY